MSNHVRVLLTALASAPLLNLVQAISFPYNPTSIFLPQISSQNKNIAYAFLPISDSDTRHQLVSFNVTSIISTSNLTFNNISPYLPFTSDDTVAFTPSISSTDEISVYTGSCQTASSSELWRFTPSNASNIGNGTWTQQTTKTAAGITSAVLPGANFLAKGMSFSTLVNANASQTRVYRFGGMCPSTAATLSTWQSAANYSNRMLKLSSSTASAGSYNLELVTSKGPPVAEAGFTLTGLTPAYSNGSGQMTQQRAYVLLGGHTQTAFINMSQVALWSMPEESWSFMTVDSPGPSNSNTELAIKSTVTNIDSRSGHTAVLTEDGSKIIVYGGWVGDVSQAADPQLAVLNIGTGFGGTGDWKWSVPNDQPSGSGIYAHGAAMLPGNVMMVLGGHNISTTSTTKRAVSPNTMFFNATSMTWTNTYANPAYLAALAKPAAKSSGSNAKNVGLGAGLGLGLGAVVIALIIFLCYSRRLKRRREEERERDISTLNARQAQAYQRQNREMGERFPWSNRGWNSGGGNDPERQMYDSDATNGYENLNTGVHNLGDNGNIPPPPRQIPRKPLHSRSARGVYQPAPAFDFNNGANHGRANSLGTAGPIHPIYEADEEEHVAHHGTIEDAGVGVALGDPATTGPSNQNRYSDPFRDQVDSPTSHHRDSGRISTPEESPARSREREIQEWVSDWAAADALMSAQSRIHSHAGRLSPTRRAQLIGGTSVSSVSGEEDGRTASNLSEQSVSQISRSGSSSQGRSRSNSLRGFINTVNPFSSGTILSTTVASTVMTPVFDAPGRSGYNPPHSAGSGTSSFTTAHTSFTALQAEADTLLPRPESHSRREESPPREPGSPSKIRGGGRGARGQIGWLGSIRRAFVSEAASGSTSPSGAFSSREPSPIRSDQPSSSDAMPRRTVSAGATLWRRKQGKSDWEDSAEDLNGGRSNTFNSLQSDGMRPGTSAGLANPNHEEDEEWDIERAVENRVVQVMFTVPKEKLRVVNHEFTPSETNSEVGSIRSKKGSGRSTKSALGTVAPPPPLPRHSTIEEKEESPSRSGSPKGKGKTKVLEMVEKMEEMSTRGESPGGSPGR
ncbi:hypothetical protein B0J14DRAFT_594799 [Halenospora varia]|nr:hypothetical protein B0J14DRAFT_594799 [Halenospora varia]